MGRRSIKKDKSVYMLAREQQGFTREKASDEIDGITPSRLEKLETGKIMMQPEDVVMLARAYKEPRLCNYYCSHDCAIGRKSIPELEEKELPRIALEMVNAVSRLYERREDILMIAEDGVLAEDEYQKFSELRKIINKLVISSQDLNLWLDKAIATGMVDTDALNQ